MEHGTCADQLVAGELRPAGAKVGDLVHPVRVAITGRSVGPGLYDRLAILGRDKSLQRTEAAV